MKAAKVYWQFSSHKNTSTAPYASNLLVEVCSGSQFFCSVASFVSKIRGVCGDENRPIVLNRFKPFSYKSN